MHPFFNRTRATIISWPTTNCRCSNGFSSSSGMVCQGMYCNPARPAACLVTARLAREGESLIFVFAREEGFVVVLAFGLLFSFFFAILIACCFLFFRPLGLYPINARSTRGFCRGLDRSPLFGRAAERC